MATEKYNIKSWCVSREGQGGIPEDGFKQDSDLMNESMLGGPARKLSWSNRSGEPCSMSLPSDEGASDDVEVYFGDQPTLCRVELRRYGQLLVGALTCGLGGPNDGNAGIFVAEATPPRGPVDPV
jgi:hypothetical protein